MRRRNLAKLEKLRPIKRRERPFENRLRDHLEDNYAVYFTKAKPTRVGWPDRTACGYGSIRLVELKRHGEDLDETQVIVHGDLLRVGVSVVVIDSGMGLVEAARIVVRALKDSSYRHGLADGQRLTKGAH